MIAFDNDTKNAYKDFMREIQIYGELKLARKRISKNILNPFGEQITLNRVTVTTTPKSVSVKSTTADTTYNYVAIKLDTNKVLGKTIYVKTDYTSETSNPRALIYGMYDTSPRINYGGETKTDSSGSISFSIEMPSEMPSNANQFALLLYANASVSANANKTTTYNNIMISDTDVNFEEYGIYINDYTTFELNEENESQILNFTINELADVYYTSLPCNTMNIDVNNEKGYFTDYDPDSIVRKLNSDCYIDLYLKINDGEFNKIMTMNFDKISYSDYYTAKLNFKSVNSTLKNLLFKDKTQQFGYNLWTKERFTNYLKDNYNITAIYDMEDDNANALRSAEFKSDSVEDLILSAGTSYATSVDTALIITNDSQNRIRYVHWKTSPEDTITKDYQLEKPIIKRENTYQGVDYTYLVFNKSVYETSTTTYNKTISGKLTSTREILIYRDNLYNLKELTINNLSTTGDITLSLGSVNSINYNCLQLIIEGDIGQEYTITITKENIKKRVTDDVRQFKYGNMEDTSKILVIDGSSPLVYYYFKTIMQDKSIRSYVEVKMIGLPYIEVGDTVEVQTDNADVLITISEITLEYTNGLNMTIKGYELSWDSLFPSNTLYPSDDLYPNMQL